MGPPLPGRVAHALISRALTLLWGAPLALFARAGNDAACTRLLVMPSRGSGGIGCAAAIICGSRPSTSSGQALRKEREGLIG